MSGDDAAAAVRDPVRRQGQGRRTSRELMAQPDIDGALVGGASLDPEEFALIAKYK